jgi:hypothetical protein
MVQFTLEIDFDDDKTLATLAAVGQCVTVVRTASAFVRSFGAASDFGTPPPTFPVAWLGFQPFQSNRLTWTDAVEIFAIAGIPAAEESILPNSRTSNLSPGQTATLQNGSFTLAATAGLAGYRAVNKSGAVRSFGLLGAATLNDLAVPLAPMCVQPVMSTQATDFRFDPGTITVFLSNIGSNGWLMPSGDFSGLTVKLDATTPQASLGFNDVTGAFFLKS